MAGPEDPAPAYPDRLPLDPFAGKGYIYEQNADPPRLVFTGPDGVRDDPQAEAWPPVVWRLYPPAVWRVGDDVIVDLEFPSAGEAHDGA